MIFHAVGDLPPRRLEAVQECSQDLILVNLFNDLTAEKKPAAAEHARGMCHGRESGGTQLVQGHLDTDGPALQPAIVDQAEAYYFASLREAITTFSKNLTCVAAETYSALCPVG